MTPQTVSQIVAAASFVFTAVGGLGAYYFGSLQQSQSEKRRIEAEHQLSEQMKSIESKTELVYRALALHKDVWTAVEMKNVPPGVTDYLLLLFASDKGRISGKARVQGSNDLAFFSTTANNKIPVAVPNVWIPEAHQYRVPTIILA
jgi:hypothetical protein